MISSMLLSLRQALYQPKEFRIPAPQWRDITKGIEDLVNLLQGAPSEAEREPGEDEMHLLPLIVDISTGLWRMQQRLTSAEAKEATGHVKRVSRDLESTWDALRQGGIEIRDHTGEKYDGGMALRVIAFQPMAELSQEQVIETIRPTIYYRDRIARMGEVIVGTPEADTTEQTPKHE